MTFHELRPGDLVLQYGLAETSRHDDAKLSIRVNGEPMTIPKIRARDHLYTVTVPLPEAQNSLEILVSSPPKHWRHLCLDGVIRPQRP